MMVCSGTKPYNHGKVNMPRMHAGYAVDFTMMGRFTPPPSNERSFEMTAATAAFSRRKWTWVLWAAPAVVIAGAAAAWLGMMMGPPPADLDLSRTQQSENGL